MYIYTYSYVNVYMYNIITPPFISNEHPHSFLYHFVPELPHFHSSSPANSSSPEGPKGLELLHSRHLFSLRLDREIGVDHTDAACRENSVGKNGGEMTRRESPVKNEEKQLANKLEMMTHANELKNI